MLGETTNQVGLLRLLILFLLANTAMIAAYQSVHLIMLPARIDTLTSSGKVETLALITTLAELVGAVAMPLGGALSDRTRSRFGRRTPWICGMSLLSAGVLSVLNWTPTVSALALLTVSLWMTLGMYQGAFNAVLPDRIPVRRRALASSLIGLGIPLGVLVGVNLGGRLDPQGSAIAASALFVICSALLSMGMRESPSTLDIGAAVEADANHNFTSFFSAFRSPDFVLAFGGRGLLFIAFFAVNGYLYYTVQDYIGVSQVPHHDAGAAVATLGTVFVVGWITLAGPASWLISRPHALKRVVALSAVGVGVTMVIPIIFPTWNGMLIYIALSGAFVGVFFSGDFALMSLVLPNSRTAGRDFAMLAVASSISQVISSPIAATLIKGTGGYVVLYSFSSVCAVAGAFLISRIKKSF